MSYKTFCAEKYQKIFENAINQGQSETVAQRFAISESAVSAFKKYTDIEPADIWTSIHEAHVNRKTGTDISAEIINAVTSADQSWKKSSGHAFEEALRVLANDAFLDSKVSIILQKDLSQIIKGGTLSNEVRDISWLREQTQAGNFDLYSIVEDTGRNFVFGCIQAKTSIRDRVKGDREHSEIAMSAFFWSIALVLDGDFLRLPKFRGMVNGKTATYKENGWHGLYSLSLEQPEDRLYHLDIDFSLLKSHAELAASQWLEQRQWFNKSWKPDN